RGCRSGCSRSAFQWAQSKARGSGCTARRSREPLLRLDRKGCAVPRPAAGKSAPATRMATPLRYRRLPADLCSPRLLRIPEKYAASREQNAWLLSSALGSLLPDSLDADVPQAALEQDTRPSSVAKRIPTRKRRSYK